MGVVSAWLWFSLCVCSMFSFGFSLFIIPWLIRKAPSWGVLDFPNERKAHAQPTPRLGGLGIAPALWFGILVALSVHFFFPSSLSASAGFANWSLGLLIGSAGFFLIGVLDDVSNLRVRSKLIGEIFFAILAVVLLPIPTHFLDYQIPAIWMNLILISWLVIVPNSVNLLDGIDGLTGILMGTFLLVVGNISYRHGELEWLFVILPTFFAVAGFTRYNWNPAKVFLGDSGSLTLGFLLAYLSIYFAIVPYEKIGTSFRPEIAFFFAAVWITDTCLAIARRYSEKHPSWKSLAQSTRIKKLKMLREAFGNIFNADANHIHHKFLRWGFSVQSAVVLMAIFGLGTMVLAIPLRRLNDLENYNASIHELAGLSFWVGSLAIFLSIFTTLALAMRNLKLGLIKPDMQYRADSTKVAILARPTARPELRKIGQSAPPNVKFPIPSEAPHPLAAGNETAGESYQVSV